MRFDLLQTLVEVVPVPTRCFQRAGSCCLCFALRGVSCLSERGTARELSIPFRRFQPWFVPEVLGLLPLN